MKSVRWLHLLLVQLVAACHVCFVLLFEFSMLKFTLLHKYECKSINVKILSVRLQQRAECILHVMSKVNSHVLLTLE